MKSSSQLADYSAGLLDKAKQLPDLYEQLLDLYEQLPDLCEQLPDLYEQLPDLYEQLPDLCEQLPDLCEQPPDLYEQLLDLYEQLPDLYEQLPDLNEQLPDLCEDLYVYPHRFSTVPSELLRGTPVFPTGHSLFSGPKGGQIIVRCFLELFFVVQKPKKSRDGIGTLHFLPIFATAFTEESPAFRQAVAMRPGAEKL